MITVLSAVVKNKCFAITFTKLKYQFVVDGDVLLEDTNYLNVRAEFMEAVGF
jgi:hypothetical protein